MQTHVGDDGNLGPRVGMTWAPFASGRTTLRGSAGIFYDWLATGTYEESLRVDGVRQQELNILNPSFPDPGTPASCRRSTATCSGTDYGRRGSRGSAPVSIRGSPR